MTTTEQFEAWWKSAYADSYDKSTVGYVLAKSIAWTAWQASRAAIELELPKTFPGEYNTLVMYVDDVESSLESAGIKVKE